MGVWGHGLDRALSLSRRIAPFPHSALSFPSYPSPSLNRLADAVPRTHTLTTNARAHALTHTTNARTNDKRIHTHTHTHTHSRQTRTHTHTASGSWYEQGTKRHNMLDALGGNHTHTHTYAHMLDALSGNHTHTHTHTCWLPSAVTTHAHTYAHMLAALGGNHTHARTHTWACLSRLSRSLSRPC